MSNDGICAEDSSHESSTELWCTECGAPMVFPDFDFDENEGALDGASGLKVNMRLPIDSGFSVTIRVRSGNSPDARVQVAVSQGDCVEIGDAIVIRVG